MNTSMNNTNTNGQHLLLIRNNGWDKSLSPEELQNVMGQWMAWFNRLNTAGKIRSANPLENEGKVVSWRNGAVTDGPFAESKEAIGGYFLLQIENFDEALQVARQCPALPYGCEVEVRPVAQACEASMRVNQSMAVGLP